MFKNIDGIVSDTFLLGLLSSIELKNNNGVLEINKDTIITQTGVSIGITASSMFMGAWGGDTTYGVLTHKNFKTLNPAKYAILQDPVGYTYVSGENVSFATNGTIQAKMTSSKMLFNYYNTDIDFQVNTLNSYFKADAGSDRFAIGCSPSHWIDLMPKSGQDGYMRISTEDDVEQGFRLERNKPAGSYNTAWINYIPNDSKELRWYNGSDLLSLNENGKITIPKGVLEIGGEAVTSGYINSPEGLYVNFDKNDDDAGQVFEIASGREGQSGGVPYLTITELAGVVFNSGGNDLDFIIKDDDSNDIFRIDVASKWWKTTGGVKVISPARFGYSTTYRAIQIGSADVGYNSNIFIGVDLSANNSSNFSGNGSELYFRNEIKFRSPNATNDAYWDYLQFSDGNTIIAGVPIFSNTDVPATAGATGITGQRAWDANYIYLCVATDTWKRTAIATW